MKPRVVIIGAGFAGFAGIQAAKKLAKSSVEVVLIDRHNYQTFQPLLHQVATGFIESEQVAYPIRSYFRRSSNLKFHLAEVKQIDLSRRLIETTKGLIDYNYLILATGSKANYSRVIGAKEFTWNLKTLPAAVSLRNHIFRCFEAAIDQKNSMASLLTFAIVGGGITGVEVAGSLAELINGSFLRDYPSLISKVRIVLIHSGNKLLGRVPAKLHRYTSKKLQKLGVEVDLETRVREVNEQGVTLNSGEFIPSRTVIWSAGVQGNTFNTASLIPTTRGKRIAVLPTLQLDEFPNVYVAGDLAGLKQDEQYLPMVAPAAIQQGKAVAFNIKRQILGLNPTPFRYRHLGSMAIIGRHAAVAQIGQFTFTGWFAWLLWLLIHLANLSGMRHRLLVLIDWIWNYFTNEQPDRLICPQQLKTVPIVDERIPINLTVTRRS